MTSSSLALGWFQSFEVASRPQFESSCPEETQRRPDCVALHRNLLAGGERMVSCLLPVDWLPHSGLNPTLVQDPLNNTALVVLYSRHN